MTFFQQTKGQFWLRDKILTKKDFSFNGSQFVRVIRELSPDWVEIFKEDGNNFYRLTRNGWDFGTHLYRRWQRVNGTSH